MSRWVYCKYCYKNVRPSILREKGFFNETVQVTCSECGAGLEPFTEVPPDPKEVKTTVATLRRMRDQLNK
jgi:uncharacterized Zn finger protein